jgi:hypothetical protein
LALPVVPAGRASPLFGVGAGHVRDEAQPRQEGSMTEGLAVVPEAPKRGPKTEIEKLQDALKAADAAIESLKRAVREAEKCDVPGMDVKRNLGGKLGALLSETGLAVPRKKA